MPGGFYVEVYQPAATAAELHATLDTFDAAVAWLKDRLAEDGRRLPRLRGHMDEEQRAEAHRMGLSPG